MSEIIISDNYTRAYSLDKKIKANAQVVQESLYEICKGLKEMRDDKLYKELGYQNFEEYTKAELEIDRRQAYRYINIAENLTSDFVTSMSQIGTTKLTMLSKLDEATRNEIVKNTDVSGTSVKELEKQIRELKGENDKLRQAEEKYIEEVGKVKKELADAEEENNLLSGQIYELENQPRDIVIATEESREIRNMEKAMEKLSNEFAERYDKLQDENEREVLNLNRKHNAEIEKLKAEYENKLKSVPTETVTDTKEIFRAYLSNAVDSAKRLMDFIRDNPDDFYISKAKDFYSRIMEEL